MAPSQADHPPSEIRLVPQSYSVRAALTEHPDLLDKSKLVNAGMRNHEGAAIIS